MKHKMARLAQRYAVALRKHLNEGQQASLHSARGLGRQAVGLGLETLDVARMHEGALAALDTASAADGSVERAELFFTEAITPIEKTHPAAVQADAHLDRVHQKLGRRTVDLAAANRSLKKTILRRKVVEKALKKRGGNSKTLLEESRRLQTHLRHLTHKILSAQEEKRKKISQDLQDEIAQTLLGINVRLLTLKQEASATAQGFKKEIASTQRLVDDAGKSIKRFAREMNKHHEK